jgi:hypothetical protein
VPNAPTAAEPTTTVEISKSAELLQSLSAFQQSDQKRFSEVLGAVASNLKAAANAPSGQHGTELGQLADRLMVAANTGNLSGIAQGTGIRPGAMQRAVDAYRRHAPAPSQTVSDALDYVQEVVRDAGDG